MLNRQTVSYSAVRLNAGRFTRLTISLSDTTCKLNSMKILFRLNPSGKFLMDFCFINLWSFENQVNLLSGGNITEKIQFFFVKRKIRKLLKKAYKLIHLMAV